MDDIWLTAQALSAEAPEVPDYVVEELIIRGAITELSAKIKAGKTTFLGKTLYAMFNGDPIIGLTTCRTTTLYLTEEGPNTYRSMLARSGLTEEENLHVLMRGKVSKIPWADLVSGVIMAKVKETQAGLVIVDTLSRWAGIRADQENWAGAAAMAVEPLEELRDAGVAVLTVHHDRKGESEIGDSSRGSSAWGGAGDILLRLTNPHTHGHPNRRVLESLGRFSDPCKWQMELTNGEYIYQGDGQAAEREDAKANILTALLTNDLTWVDIEAMDIPRTTGERAMNELIREGMAYRKGAGRKGDPFRFSCSQ